MAGKLTFALMTAALAASPFAIASDQSPNSPAPKRRGLFGGGEAELHRPPGNRADFEKFENVRKAIEALTPEQRKRFQENFQRWSNLPPEEKKALADREMFRRKKIAEEISSALADSALDLSNDQRELFAKRYVEERHKIEEQLRKEMEEKRLPLLKEIVARLKAEFSSSSPATGGASVDLPAGKRVAPLPENPPKP